MIPRFYNVTAGQIRLDGIDIKEYNRENLRQNIGMVEQDPFLFTETIEANIAYGVHRRVSRLDVENAAKAAAVHDSIMEFKDGYDTLVGEKGVSLSGGQKQRIAIARALLKDPAVLILDDSTSAVDAATEIKIQKSLDTLMKGRTTFIIAHRVGSLMKADKILVMKQGQIVQMGNHKELIKEQGFYREIFEMQTQIEKEIVKDVVGDEKKKKKI